LPTVVQNVETLSVIPWVVRRAEKPDSKAFCLSGAVARPGVYEAKLGTSLSQLLAAAGGEVAGSAWKMALIGGPMGRVLPASRFDTQLDYATLPGLGHGGIVLMDQRVSARALYRHLSAFARSESCGNCTPCRVGCAQLDRVTERGALERLLRTLAMGSLCGFGQGVPRPLFDLIEHFGAELFP
jgi:formate dehydrogenase